MHGLQRVNVTVTHSTSKTRRYQLTSKLISWIKRQTPPFPLRNERCVSPEAFWRAAALGLRFEKLFRERVRT